MIEDISKLPVANLLAIAILIYSMFMYKNAPSVLAKHAKEEMNGSAKKAIEDALGERLDRIEVLVMENAKAISANHVRIKDAREDFRGLREATDELKQSVYRLAVALESIAPDEAA